MSATVPLWLRLIAGFLFEVVSAAAVIGIPGTWLVRHADLARLAARQASDALNRPVTLDSLRVLPGSTIRIEAAGLVILSIAGGSGPDMVRLRRATATLDARSLLHGPLLLRDIEAEGLAVLLERAPDRTPNWRFGPRRAPAGDPTGRTTFPSIRNVKLQDSAVTYHTTGGKDLVTRLEHVTIQTPADDQTVRLAMDGNYNDVPMSLDGDLQPIAALRDAPKPYGTVLRMAAGDIRLTFDGTMTDPLNVNGATGTLEFEGPDLTALYGIAGLKSGPAVSLFLSGRLIREEPAWRLEDAHGSLESDEVVKATLAFEEGADGKPDKVALDLVFDGLHLNDMLGEGAKGKRGSADLPLVVDRVADPHVQARVAAKTLEYASVDANDVVLAGAIEDGRVTVDELSLTTFGARVQAAGRIEAAGAASRVTADVSAANADIQVLRRALGFGSLPLSGRLQAQVAVDATAPTLNTAVRAARASAVVAMRGGGVERSLVEMASTDVRALFRTSKGITPLTCLLMGVDMRAGIGTLAPLRLRAQEGTIAGSARFDLYRRTFDLTIGSEAKSTGLFALDIPVRASGSFAAPIVSPAQWSAEGRALLAAADNLTRLPPALQAFARRYPCPRG